MGSIQSVFSEIRRRRGSVARIYSDFAAIPPAVRAHFERNKALVLGRMPLSRLEREWPAVPNIHLGFILCCKLLLFYWATVFKNSWRGIHSDQ